MAVLHVRTHLWPLKGSRTGQVECGVVEFHSDNVLLTSAPVEICKSLELNKSYVCILMLLNSTHQCNDKRHSNDSSNDHTNYAAVVVIEDMNSFSVFVSCSFNFVSGNIRRLWQLLELLCSLSLCK